ncbi:MAG: hypothetical protein AB7S92_24400 [Parvibaculaceae bacterium]|jgi:hypothetical protein
MQKTITVVLAALALGACAGHYGHDEQSYKQCVRLAREEGQVIEYIATTLRYRRKHYPGPETEAEWRSANEERRAIHAERRHLGCI